ncbi:hypothetical protein KC866_00410 [Patescibacteria group bacterium]|nr:hypothetical protein [Patescibacteria group bacterium]
MNHNSINAVYTYDWVHYLTRPFNLFTSSLWYEWYVAPERQELFGVEIDTVMFIEETPNVVRNYRIREQHDAYLSALEALVLDEPERCVSLLRKGIELNNYATRYMSGTSSFDTLESAVQFLIPLALHATVLPYFVLRTLELKNINNTELRELATSLRIDSYYPKVMQDIIVPMAVKQLSELGINEPEHALECITYQELRARTTSVLNQRLQDRLAGKLFVFHVIRGEHSVQYVDDTQKLIVTIEGFDANQNQKTLHGTVAHPGKVTGTARIVRTIDGSDVTFNPGDILVSINSNPHLMPLITKAAAIVTDEGGVGCHAAIVSRELQIPCIIGTHVATTTLHDGDLVEVDADNGAVTILERA